MPDDSLGRLNQVEHIVVLMMENRSFDHMLGYLKLNNVKQVDGLDPAMSNPDETGAAVHVHELPPDFTAFHAPGRPLDESLDPCHDPDDVAQQLQGGNRGFVKNFIERKQPTDHRDLPMGYFTATHLPVYDFLARTFCVCDAWHSSIPGDTMPNRCYSIAGREGESVAAELDVLKPLVGTKAWKKLENIPIYDLPAFTRLLDDSQWRWYSYDPASLRSVDSKYRSAFHLDRDNFAYFDRKSVSLALQAAEVLIVGGSFLDDAANGKLRDVSWIDPNFIDLRVFDTSGNDDHPPSDIHAGQALVLDLFEALVDSPGWQDTVLVITYDEHGGFFDHVIPPAVPAGDGGAYATYGVRVPAIVVGPRVRNGVCSTLLDHTSLIATILRRFAADPGRAIAAMPHRVGTAAHIGDCLLDQPRDDVGPSQLAPAIANMHARINAWHQAAVAGRRAQPKAPSVSPDGAGHPLVMHSFARDFKTFALLMRQHLGLPSGQP
jgi:phospholipase C